MLGSAARIHGIGKGGFRVCDSLCKRRNHGGVLKLALINPSKWAPDPLSVFFKSRREAVGAVYIKRGLTASKFVASALPWVSPDYWCLPKYYRR